MHNHDNHLKCPFCKNDVNIKKALLNEYSPEVHNAYKERFKDKEENQANTSAIQAKTTEDQKQEAIKLAKWQKDLKSKDIYKNQEVTELAEKLAQEKVNAMMTDIDRKAVKKAEAIFAPEIEKASNIDKENIELKQQLLKFEQGQKNIDKKTQHMIDEALAKQDKEHRKENEFKDIEHTEELEKVKKNSQKIVTQINQGSSQAQGSVGEISVKNHLESLFPLDKITQTKNGADVLQEVNDGINSCGKIYCEIKRTTRFDKNWLPKFNSDSRDKKAHARILITETMPSGMTQPGKIDGIWICSFHDYEPLVLLHRDYIISNFKSSQAQQNSISGSMLTYNYVNSEEFERRVENFYSNLSKTDLQIDKEQRCMNQSWSERRSISAILSKDMDNIIGTLSSYSTDSSAEIESLEMAEIGINE